MLLAKNSILPYIWPWLIPPKLSLLDGRGKILLREKKKTLLILTHPTPAVLFLFHYRFRSSPPCSPPYRQLQPVTLKKAAPFMPFVIFFPHPFCGCLPLNFFFRSFCSCPTGPCPTRVYFSFHLHPSFPFRCLHLPLFALVSPPPFIFSSLSLTPPSPYPPSPPSPPSPLSAPF